MRLWLFLHTHAWSIQPQSAAKLTPRSPWNSSDKGEFRSLFALHFSAVVWSWGRTSPTLSLRGKPDSEGCGLRAHPTLSWTSSLTFLMIIQRFNKETSPVFCNYATTTRQPPNPHNLHCTCRRYWNASVHTPGSHSICVIGTQLGFDRKILSTRRELMPSLILGYCWPFHFPPHNVSKISSVCSL